MADVYYVRIYIHIIHSSSAIIDEMRPERLSRLVGVISSFFVCPFAIIFIRKVGGGELTYVKTISLLASLLAPVPPFTIFLMCY